MASKILKKYLNLFYCIPIKLILLFSIVGIGSSSAHAFFEDQARYAFKHHWLPMLNDESQENRYQSMLAFLNYPEWGLPVLRNLVMSNEPKNASWQIGMLIGMIGDTTDIPALLKFWREMEDKKLSTVWFGAMQRIYWKNRVQGGAPLKLKILTKNFLRKDLKIKGKKETVALRFRIENPSYSPRFIRVGAHFWKTSIRENLTSKYFWLPAGKSIESTISSKFSPVKHTNNVRLDFRVWEVGLSNELLHEVVKIDTHENSASNTDN